MKISISSDTEITTQEQSLLTPFDADKYKQFKSQKARNAHRNYVYEDITAEELDKRITKFHSICGSKLKDNYRKAANAEIYSTLLLDFDDNSRIANVLTHEDGEVALIYTSLRHQDDNPNTDKFRVVIPLFIDLEVGGEVFGKEITVKFINKFIKEAARYYSNIYECEFDGNATDISRYMYGNNGVKSKYINNDGKMQRYQFQEIFRAAEQADEKRIKKEKREEQFKPEDNIPLTDKQKENAKSAIDSLPMKDEYIRQVNSNPYISLFDKKAAYNAYWKLSLACEAIFGIREPILRLIKDENDYIRGKWKYGTQGAYNLIIRSAKLIGWEENELINDTIERKEITNVLKMNDSNLILGSLGYEFNDKVIVIQSHQGTQKTRLFIDLNRQMQLPLISITHRVALVEDIANTIGSTSYTAVSQSKTLKESTYNGNLVTTINSLKKYRYSNAPYNIWIDEWTQVWRELHKLTENQNTKDIVEILSDFLSRANQIFLTDADYDIDVIDEILHLGKRELSECKHLINNWRPQPKNITFYSDRNNILDVISNKLKSGIKCSVAFNVNNRLKEFKNTLLDLGLKEDEIITITGEDTKEEKKDKIKSLTRPSKGFFDDSGSIVSNKIKAFLYTSAAYTGVSVNKHDFTEQFGVFEYVHGIIADDMLQAMNRCRDYGSSKIENWHVFAVNVNPGENTEVNINDRLHGIIKEDNTVDFENANIYKRIEARHYLTKIKSSLALDFFKEKLISIGYDESKFNIDKDICEVEVTQTVRINKDELWNSVDAATDQFVEDNKQNLNKLSKEEQVSIVKYYFKKEGMLDYAKDLKYDKGQLYSFKEKAELLIAFQNTNKTYEDFVKGYVTVDNKFRPKEISKKMGEFLSYIRDYEYIQNTIVGKEHEHCSQEMTQLTNSSSIKTFSSHASKLGFTKTIKRTKGIRKYTYETADFFKVFLGKATSKHNELIGLVNEQPSLNLKYTRRKTKKKINFN